MDLNSGMMKLNTNPQFEHIRKLTIDSKCTNKLKRHIECRTTSPFKQLEILQFDHTSLNDIAFITLWINHASTVNCQNIPVNESGTVHMPNFSFLKKLNHFKLQFSRKCSLKLTFFFNEPDLNTLPSSLKSLELINIYDEEENWISRQDVLEATAYILMRDESTRASVDWKRTLLPVQIWDIWLKLENRLVLKYKMLASLPNLTRLSLDRISSFTARIWNECLLPCSSQLTFVSFKGWYGDRESPRSIIRRVQNEEKEVDVEQALSRFISSLSNIKEIVLDDFVCTVGLIQGLQKLDKEYTIDRTLEVGKKLSNCKITIKTLK
ncbi:hypothetical protein BD770DRAFT_56038 [Pilaira anomala]|nr:hypothetical protein BD770DRAFT_56038 [Pilaira anomala]